MKLGIVGSGKVVDMVLSAGVQEVVEVPLLYCRNEEKGRLLQMNYGMEIGHDYDAFLATKQIDTVYIGLPNALHYEFAKKALLAHKNVILEKPFTSTLEQAKELIDLAKQAKHFLFEAILTRYSTHLEELKNALKEIGHIQTVCLDFQQRSSRYDAYLNHEVAPVFNPKLDGGALMDINIYNVHFAIQLWGKPRSYRYEKEIGWNGVDVRGIVYLEYPDFIVECIGSKKNDVPPCQKITGQFGSIEIEHRPGDLHEIHIKKDGIEEVVGKEAENIFQNEFSQIQKVIDAKNFEQSGEWLKDSLNVMEVIEKLRHS
ncbi:MULTISPECIES: Gfo/Idh/MocA family protein [Terrabacteria group]|uniref:Gfo/Idh/MocA family protein n=1 Tax=Bacillati TaxID=1783272 RepID=UPI001C6E980E|nr:MULTISPECIES: Gfo/Idh/MocA family oxidoreductase [Terrabacteria group]MBW9212573.1 Gfo/Idh/MocA family oxidoreductase [Trueperella sp. zg.1013]